MAKSKNFEERRTKLKSLFAAAKMAIAMGTTDASHVNEWVLEYYMEQNPEISEFNTFHQWKEKGCSVKKGSKAFVIWGSPRKGKKQDNPKKKIPQKMNTSSFHCATFLLILRLRKWR